MGAPTAGRLSGIYGIVNEGEPDPVQLTQALLRGGVGIIQYRAKSGVLLDTARALRELTARFDALYLINDDWQAAIAAGADGVHLGPEDAGAQELLEIRTQMRGRLVGLSCGTVAEAEQAQALGADYIGVGAVFATTSKADAGEPIGLAALARITAAVEIPVCAIGGITAGRLGQVRASGAAMAAVLSAFSISADPRDTARQFTQTWRMG